MITKKTANYAISLVGLMSPIRRTFKAFDALIKTHKDSQDAIDAELTIAEGKITALEARQVYLPFVIPATELAAGTPIQLVSPVAGVISKLVLTVQTAIVTGGPVTVRVGAVDVIGLTLPIANAAAVGVIAADAPTTPGSATTVVAVESQIQIVPDAAFNGGGALAGYIAITRT